jgi:hypothetical protein
MQVMMQTRPVQLVSTTPAADLWEDMTGWMATEAVLGVSGVLILADRVSPFQVRIGIQTAVADVEIDDAPLNPVDAGGTGLGYVTAVSKNFYSFDPTVSTAGNINAKAYFRIGLLYSSSDLRTVARGDVRLEVTYRT